MPPTTSSRLSLSRLAAATTFAIVALTACNPTGGETTIESSAPAADLPAIVLPTSAPVATESAPPASSDSSPAAEPAVVEVDDVTVVDDDEGPTDAAAPDSDDATPAETDAGNETDDATETAQFNITGANCLDGRWIAAPGEIQLYFDTIGLANGIDMNGSGYLIIVLEDGNYVYDARIVNEINIDGFPTTSVVDGVTQGNYTYENGFIVANETAGSIDAYVDAGGIRVDASDLGDDFAQMAAFHEAPYDCNGDNPSIYFDVAPGVARYEMKFIPWDGVRP